jgi:DNA-binding NarL/FixJ family response regulator
VPRPKKKKASNKVRPEKIRLLLVDDEETVRRGLRALFEGEGWEICGEAMTGLQAVDRAKSLRPDIVILDITLPELNGVDAAEQILQNNDRQKIIILTDLSTNAIIRDCLNAGVRGYLLKSGPASDLIAAVKALKSNRTFFTRAAEIIAHPPSPGKLATT